MIFGFFVGILIKIDFAPIMKLRCTVWLIVLVIEYGLFFSTLQNGLTNFTITSSPQPSQLMSSLILDLNYFYKSIGLSLCLNLQTVSIDKFALIIPTETKFPMDDQQLLTYYVLCSMINSY
ncbi:hypothetical protein R6Q59_010821 [Mikania micrantha]